MKKISFLLLLLCFVYLLLFPETAVSSARDGLLLWYQNVLPVLFPFMLLCSLSLHLDLLDSLPSPCFRPICRLFHCSSFGAFAIITGFLCGFPMGAKITSDLYAQNKISRTEAKFLYGFVNNLSPGFLLSYIAMQQLSDASAGLTLLIPVLGGAVLYGILSSFLLRKNPKETTGLLTASDPEHSAAGSVSAASDPVSFAFFPAFDHCLSDTIHNIVKLGAYIMIFCMIVHGAVRLFPQSICHLPSLLFFSSIEITNGVHMIAASSFSYPVKYLSLTAASAFGGLSALAQTITVSGMDRELLFYYIKSRVMITLLSLCIAACSLLFCVFL